MRILSLLTLLFVFSQGTLSQNCEAISPYKEGMKLEYTNYNKKGKERSIDSYVVKSVTKESGNLVILIETVVKEGKKDAVARQQTLKCEHGNFYIDMADYMSHQSDDQKSTLQVKAEGDFVEFPENLESGMALADGKIDLKLSSEGGASDFSFASMSVLNRKVLEGNKLTTKAGEFEGYKVSFDYLFNMGILKIRGSGIEWYVKGVGIVKSESYSKKGKLRWTRELTKMSK